jgi:hypothetical protein
MSLAAVVGLRNALDSQDRNRSRQTPSPFASTRRVGRPPRATDEGVFVVVRPRTAIYAPYNPGNTYFVRSRAVWASGDITPISPSGMNFLPRTRKLALQGLRWGHDAP